jgi:replicative DNA helicase
MLKQLPNNIEAEQSVLASMIIDIDVLEKFFDEFDIEIFYEKIHIKIIETIFELYNE